MLPTPTPAPPPASKDDRYAHELVGRTDVKLCGLFLDGLKIQACVPLCNPVVAPPKLT